MGHVDKVVNGLQILLMPQIGDSRLIVTVMIPQHVDLIRLQKRWVSIAQDEIDAVQCLGLQPTAKALKQQLSSAPRLAYFHLNHNTFCQC